VEVRDFHLTTVFGLMPYFCASALMESDDDWISAREAGVVVAEPCIENIIQGGEHYLYHDILRLINYCCTAARMRRSAL